MHGVGVGSVRLGIRTIGIAARNSQRATAAHKQCCCGAQQQAHKRCTNITPSMPAEAGHGLSDAEPSR